MADEDGWRGGWSRGPGPGCCVRPLPRLSGRAAPRGRDERGLLQPRDARTGVEDRARAHNAETGHPTRMYGQAPSKVTEFYLGRANHARTEPRRLLLGP